MLSLNRSIWFSNLAVYFSLHTDNIFQAAFWYGLVVHLRIYPIIYALPIVLLLDPRHFESGKKPKLTAWSFRNIKSGQISSSKKFAGESHFWLTLRNIFTWRRIIFGLISAVVFFICTGISFYLYGWDFLHEALLYHLTRTDPRHNFSIYFYHIYLHYEQEFTVMEKLISFLPQILVQLVLVFRFSRDLPFCFFTQTLAFVAFNKVCNPIILSSLWMLHIVLVTLISYHADSLTLDDVTVQVMTAQYFVWFFCLLPLILPWSKIKLKWQGLASTLLWIGAQTHWLMWGYLLEFKGKNVFIQLWVASIVFLAANTYILISIIQNHIYSPVYRRLDHLVSDKTAKHDWEYWRFQLASCCCS